MRLVKVGDSYVNADLVEALLPPDTSISGQVEEQASAGDSCRLLFTSARTVRVEMPIDQVAGLLTMPADQFGKVEEQADG